MNNIHEHRNEAERGFQFDELNYFNTWLARIAQYPSLNIFVHLG